MSGVQGKCPNCGSDNLEYGNTELTGESMGYECECRDCGKNYIEWYGLIYSETVEN